MVQTHAVLCRRGNDAARLARHMENHPRHRRPLEELAKLEQGSGLRLQRPRSARRTLRAAGDRPAERVGEPACKPDPPRTAALRSDGTAARRPDAAATGWAGRARWLERWRVKRAVQQSRWAAAAAGYSSRGRVLTLKSWNGNLRNGTGRFEFTARGFGSAKPQAYSSNQSQSRLESSDRHRACRRGGSAWCDAELDRQAAVQQRKSDARAYGEGLAVPWPMNTRSCRGQIGCTASSRSTASPLGGDDPAELLGVVDPEPMSDRRASKNRPGRCVPVNVEPRRVCWMAQT